MQSPEGGYYSSLDADSEGKEGHFYTWDKQQLESLLNREELGLVNKRFAIDRGPNFTDKFHLHEFVSLHEFAQSHDYDIDYCYELWRSARQKLYKQRLTRIAPGRDDKILVSWNALMIKAMLIASRVFKQEGYFISATRALDFIITKMLSNGRLFATYKDGTAHLNAYLDDYAFLLDALLEFLQTKWRNDYLQLAIKLADVLLDQFEDKKEGGFYFTSNDHEALIQRPKVVSDEATPAGNGIAAYSLLRLGYLLCENKYIHAAERTLEFASQQINNTPMANASLLRCYEELNAPPETIIIRGANSNMEAWQQECQKYFHPSRMIFSIANDTDDLPKELANKHAHNDKTIAYLCRGTQCLAPIESLDLLKDAINI